MLTPTLAFLQSPPWPGTAFAQEGFQSFKLSHQCCQLFLLCSLSPSPSCCHPGQARLTPVLPVIPVMFTPTSPVSHSSDAHSDPRLLVVASLAAHCGNMHAPGWEPRSAQSHFYIHGAGGRPPRGVMGAAPGDCFFEMQCHWDALARQPAHQSRREMNAHTATAATAAAAMPPPPPPPPPPSPSYCHPGQPQQ